MAFRLRLHAGLRQGGRVPFIAYPAFIPQHAGACHRETCRAIISRPAARDWMLGYPGRAQGQNQHLGKSATKPQTWGEAVNFCVPAERGKVGYKKSSSWYLVIGN